MINVIAPINPLGYGVAGLNICKSLQKHTEIALWPIGQPSISTKDDYLSITKATSNSMMWNNEAPCVKIWHQHDMAQFVGKGLRIGFPFFELDEFSSQEKHSLNSLDKIFVTSEWAKEIVAKETSISDISVVPLGVDRSIFKDAKKNDSEKTIFFNCGKWEIRKGHDILVDIFNKAFEKNDNVELWLMSHNPFISEEEAKEWEGLYKNSKLGEKIRILPRVQTHEEVYNIMCQTDCGVFPSRAEGWNLELLELMSCGKQVIATNFSAHTEFCDEKNTHLVEIEEKELAYDGKWFHGSCGSWAKISTKEQEAFIEHMRNIHANKKVNEDGIKTSKVFTWENTAKRIIQNV